MHRISEVKDYGSRTVVRVVDDEVPESYHVLADGTVAPHVGLPSEMIDPATKKPYVGADGLKPYEWCKLCRHDAPLEFKWDGSEGMVGVRVVVNDVETIGTRNKTWDELYEEVDKRLGETVGRGGAVRQSAPGPVSPLEK